MSKQIPSNDDIKRVSDLNRAIGSLQAMIDTETLDHRKEILGKAIAFIEPYSRFQ